MQKISGTAVPDKAQTVPSMKEQKCQNSKELARPVHVVARTCATLRCPFCCFLLIYTFGKI